MRTRAALAVAGLLAAAPAVVQLSTPAPAAAAAPAHTLTVSGAGVGSYPGFDPAVERYAVTTTAATGGRLTVQATTSDPAGVVRVDGQVAPGGTATVAGLGPGDEVSVFIEDSAGTEVHSLVYLPAGFPALEATSPAPAAELAAGDVGLTLNPIVGQSPRFVTTVDRNGVPTHLRVATDAYDLKDQPDGSITYAEPTTTPGRTGEATVVLDDRWREVRRLQTEGLTHTDLHDSILEPDGTSWLVAYEPSDDHPGQVDSVIQHLDAAGHELWRWTSDGLQGDSVAAVPAGGAPWDYAHLNSIQLLPGGDLLASFRHLSAVLRIATTAHDGYQPGDVEWKLGGRDGDFTFVDDPDHGPCAQHTATLLPDGHVLVFDDGSDPFLAGALCVDPADPDGPPVTRQHSRVAEWALDTTDHTATLVWSYQPSGWYSWFMGSARRLENGDTLVGWAAETRALAQEVDPGGTLLWQLRLADPQPAPPPISYRASLMRHVDADAPVLDGVSLTDGAAYPVGTPVTVDFRCTDVGGSSLQTCGGDLRPGGRLDTSTPGGHTLHLTAVDGAGHTTVVTRRYTVTASYQPHWKDDRVRAALRGTRVSTELRLVNGGTYADRFVLRGTRGGKALKVRYRWGHRDVTRQVLRGTLRTDLLQPGQEVVLRALVRRAAHARGGRSRTLAVRARSVADPARTARATVAIRIHAARPGAARADARSDGESQGPVDSGRTAPSRGDEVHTTGVQDPPI